MRSPIRFWRAHLHFGWSTKSRWDRKRAFKFLKLLENYWYWVKNCCELKERNKKYCLSRWIRCGISRNTKQQAHQNKITWTSPKSRWPDRIELWSDHLRAHTCSQCARITWSGKSFERTFVWSMVWNLPDQRPLWSGTVWSEVTLVWDGLIRGSFKRTLVYQRPIRAHTNKHSKFIYSVKSINKWHNQ